MRIGAKDDKSWVLEVRATRPPPRCGQIPRHSRVAVSLPGVGVDRFDCPCPKGIVIATRPGPIQRTSRCRNESDVRLAEKYNRTLSLREPGDPARSVHLTRGMPQVSKRYNGILLKLCSAFGPPSIQNVVVIGDWEERQVHNFSRSNPSFPPKISDEISGARRIAILSRYMSDRT